MVFVKVASIKELASGKKKSVKISGKDILIANLNGKYYAIGNKCTHMGCKLSDGTLKGENIECVCHGSAFDIKTGSVVKGPAKSPEPAFKVKIDDNDILVDV